MTKNIVQQWDIQSHTDPSKSYTVSLYDDGSWGCSCPNWVYRRAECKHIQEAMSLRTKAAKNDQGGNNNRNDLTLESHIEQLHKNFDSMTKDDLYSWYKDSPYFNPAGFKYKGKGASRMTKPELLEFVKYLTTDEEVNENQAKSKYKREIDEISFDSEQELMEYGQSLVSKEILRSFKPYYNKDKERYYLDLTELTTLWWGFASEEILRKYGSYYAYVNNLVLETKTEITLEEELEITAKILEWNLSNITDLTTKGLIRTDSMILFKKIKPQFENSEKTDFFYDSSKDFLILKYLPDIPGKNDYIAAKFDLAINDIINRKISIGEISSVSQSLVKDVSDFIKKTSLRYLDESVVQNIGRIWSNLTERERKEVFFPVDDGDINYTLEWDFQILFFEERELDKETDKKIWRQQENIIQKLEILERIFNQQEYPLKYLSFDNVVFNQDDVAHWWDYLPEDGDLDLVLRKFLKNEFTDRTILKKDWEELDITFRNKFLLKLRQVRRLINKGLGKEEELTQYEILKHNILEIICSEQIKPDSDGRVSESVIWGALLGKDFYPEVQYTGADAKFINNAIKDLVDERKIQKHIIGKNYKYYSILAETECKEGGFINVKPEFPDLEVFPLIEDTEVSKRVILQAICKRLISKGEFKRLSKASIIKDWMNFFKYDNPKYLETELGLKDEFDKLQQFNEDLDYLIKNRIIVSYPETYQSPVEMITFQSRYKFIFKTYKMGILTDIMGITDCSIYVSKESIEKDKILKNFPEKKLLLLLLDKEYERFHLITKNNKANIFLIYNFKTFELVVANESNTNYALFDLGFDRKTFRTKIINEILPGQTQFNLTPRERNHWDCIKRNELLTLAATIKF